MKKGIKRYFLNLDYLEVRKTNLKQEQGFLFVCFFVFSTELGTNR